jgi:AcrR family transcriptional regulator
MTKVTDLETGRTNQKLRTRNALLAAARALIAKGASPTVEDAAEAAAISRTTAYRYFKNQAELLAAAHPEIHLSSLLPPDAPEDVETRLDIVVKEVTKRILANEAQHRTMLRLSLEEGRDPSTLVLRQGRVIGWLEDALEPARLKLGKALLRRLVLAIRASIGIEALVWLTDIAHLSRDDAAKNMRWSARALLRAALAEKR